VCRLLPISTSPAFNLILFSLAGPDNLEHDLLGGDKR
jgi:hypothetical protein